MNYKFTDRAIARICTQPYDKRNDEILADPIFKESIFLASKNFYNLLEKRKNGINDKAKLTLENYLNRAKYRPTPFGLFSSVSTHEIEISSSILNPTFIDEFFTKRRTSLNYTILFQIYENIIREKDFILQTNVYSNMSFQEKDMSLEYIEFERKELLFDYSISSVDKNEAIVQILHFFREGHPLQKGIDTLSEVLKVEKGNLRDYLIRKFKLFSGKS